METQYAKYGRASRQRKLATDPSYDQHRNQKNRLARKLYYERNRERMCAQNAAAKLKLKLEIIAAYGGKCECCGDTHTEFLTVDHVNNDGAAHRKIVKNMYCWLRKNGFPKIGFRLLCMNCNWSRGTFGHCPHELERKA